MITLSIIAYAIISLLLARHYYWDIVITSHSGQSNPCYMNGKKSLIKGFLTIPVIAVSIYVVVMVVFGFCTIVFKAIAWIFINMP